MGEKMIYKEFLPLKIEARGTQQIYQFPLQLKLKFFVMIKDVNLSGQV